MRYTILATMCGLLAACGVAQDPVLNVVLDTDSVDLGTVVPPTIAVVLPSAVVTVSNLGSGPACLTSAVLNGPMGRYVDLVDVEVPVRLEPGASALVGVRLLSLPNILDTDLGLALDLGVVGVAADSTGCDRTVDGLSDTLSIPVYVLGDARCDADGDGQYDVACGGVDCDDADADVFPGAEERCNNLDDNCNGAVDEQAVDAQPFFTDRDGDGFGAPGVALQDCALPDGFAERAGDCDDGRADTFPSAEEVCDGLDNDCDGRIDEGTRLPFWTDADGDGFGAPNTRQWACGAPAGTTDNRDDCDDTNNMRFPGAVELCDDIDDNCDGLVDDVDDVYLDADNDGFGDATSPIDGCDAGPFTSPNADDCDDTDETVNPGAEEVCNAQDDTCDGEIDEGGACPCPVETFEGRAFAFCTEVGLPFDATWNIANQACGAAGYSLASIHSEAEDDFVTETAASYSSGTWWIGLNDRRSEGNYQWSDGSPFDYEGWDTGEPNNAGNEDCGELRTTGGWNDVSCFAGRPFICATP